MDEQNLDHHIKELVEAMGRDVQSKEWLLCIDQLVELGSQAVPLLIESLVTDNVRLLGRVISTLGMIGDERAFDQITKFLHHEDKDVQYFAILAFGSFKHPDTFNQIVDFLNDEKPTAQYAAILALSDFKRPDTFDYIAKYLKAPSEDIRGCAADALGRLGDKRALELLIASLPEEEDPFVREDIVFALAEFKDEKERVLPVLTETLKCDPVQFVRETAMELIDKLSRK